MSILHGTDSLNKSLVFITGSPRSGTSMLAKVIDAHPDVGVLMERAFNNRYYRCQRHIAWEYPKILGLRVSMAYSKLKTPVVGNKNCTPDIWQADDIITFCKLFADFKIVFIVRNPYEVAISRFRRENYEREFSESAKYRILLDFRSRFLTYASSWRQSIESFWKLKDRYHDRVYIVYYEDFCQDFENQLHCLTKFLDLPFSKSMFDWHTFAHHDSFGGLKKNLKYLDSATKARRSNIVELTEIEQKNLLSALSTVKWHKELWEARKL